MAIYDEGMTGGNRAGQLVNLTGAAVSLCLMIGLGVWGYKLVSRDVSGIPVVRAVEGEMRVSPNNPGGEIALHTGLSVNAVAAEGEASAPEDTLLLAPRTAELADEDLEVQPLAEADEVVPVDEVAAEEMAVSLTPADSEATFEQGPLKAEDILALADKIAAGVAQLSEQEPETETLAVIDRSIPGVKDSLRPNVRPIGLQVAAAVASGNEVPTVAPIARSSSEVAVSSVSFPAGTKLVQLGAFPTPDAAATAWISLSGQFGDYMVGKDRVIQVANSSGRTFYRLRAMGFTDMADARRFCATLEAGEAECIPVLIQ